MLGSLFQLVAQSLGLRRTRRVKPDLPDLVVQLIGPSFQHFILLQNSFRRGVLYAAIFVGILLVQVGPRLLHVPQLLQQPVFGACLAHGAGQLPVLIF